MFREDLFNGCHGAFATFTFVELTGWRARVNLIRREFRVFLDLLRGSSRLKSSRPPFSSVFLRTTRPMRIKTCFVPYVLALAAYSSTRTPTPLYLLW